MSADEIKILKLERPSRELVKFQEAVFAAIATGEPPKGLRPGEIVEKNAGENLERVSEPPPLRFTAEDSDRANDEWGANCGPHSLAAAVGTSLEVVRLLLPDFKGWMSPTHIEEALKAMAQQVTRTKGLKTKELCQGINRIQFEGPWLKPGVPARVAYFHTHWVACRGDFVLCTVACRDMWLPVKRWRKFMDAEQPWHVTHHYAFTP